MDWQQVASLAIVAVTAVLVVRGRIRARKHGAHNCADCAVLKISREKSIMRQAHSGNVLATDERK